MSDNQRRKEFEKMAAAELKLYVLMDQDMSKEIAWDIYEVVSDRLAELDSQTTKPALGTPADVDLADLREVRSTVSDRCK